MPKASNGYDGNGCLNLSGTCFSFKTMKLNLLGANKSSLHRMMLRDKHVNFLTPTISLTNPLWPLFPNFVPTISKNPIEIHRIFTIKLVFTTFLQNFYCSIKSHLTKNQKRFHLLSRFWDRVLKFRPQCNMRAQKITATCPTTCSSFVR